MKNLLLGTFVKYISWTLHKKRNFNCSWILMLFVFRFSITWLLVGGYEKFCRMKRKWNFRYWLSQFLLYPNGPSENWVQSVRIIEDALYMYIVLINYIVQFVSDYTSLSCKMSQSSLEKLKCGEKNIFSN